MTSENILVVDDSEDNRRIISFMLQKEGYVTLEAKDGEEGLAIAQKALPDLILLDINMPGLDGYEVCKQLKASKELRDLPVIFLTAQSDTTYKLKGLALGGADYIVKPYDRAEMLARVRVQLKMRALIRELSRTNTLLADKQRRLDEDLQAAAEIQRRLLPKDKLHFKGLVVASRFLPSHSVAGDMFNIAQLDPHRIGFYILDVSGHGVAAALVTVSMLQALEPNSLRAGGVENIAELKPHQVLEILDKEYPLERFDRYVTAVYCTLDLEQGFLQSSNAGHPPPILLRRDGNMEFLKVGGTVIGMGGMLAFESEEKKLSEGDKVILYTDGVTELLNSNGEQFGEKRFIDFINTHRQQPIEQLFENLIQLLTDFSAGTPFGDDISLLGIEKTVCN